MADCAQENPRRPYLAYSTLRVGSSLLLTMIGLTESKEFHNRPPKHTEGISENENAVQKVNSTAEPHYSQICLFTNAYF